MRIKILADSTCDLTDELLAKHDIRRLPLGIVIGDKILKDGVEATPFDIFAYVDSGKGICMTNAINVAEYVAAYREEFENGADAILNFTISAELSSCYENSVLAAQDFENVYSIDTRSLSTGGGWLVLYAAELVAEGMSAADVAAACEKKKELSDASFVIDTLGYLHKGGRCSGLTAFAASALNLKPCLNLINGKIEVGKKYHGNIEKSLRRYIEDRLKGRTDLDMRRAIVTHTMFDNLGFVHEIVNLVKSLQPFKVVDITSAGCTISNHCGPNTMGVLIYREA
ncbi:MAG: DegV family protein [Coriobacteriia bacterium]|nr:DegV family protein [Coriobacteriia bacterium]